jgi:CHAT domain-containing protein
MTIRQVCHLMAAVASLAAAPPLPAQPVPLDDAARPGERPPGGDRGALEREAIAANNRALDLYEQGMAAQAVAPAEEALRLRRLLYPPRTHPDGHPRLAEDLNNLGIILKAAGELARAEAASREAVAVCRRLYRPGAFPRGHPELAACLSNLGALLRKRGDLAAAEPVLREALAMRGKLYPPHEFPAGHRDLADSLNNLGTLLLARGDPAAAEPFLRERLAMERRLYPEASHPDGHPRLVAGLSNLGQALKMRGDLAGAEAPQREALVMGRRLYPPGRFPRGHPHLAACLTNLGTLLIDRGELTAAEPLLREALQAYRRLYPADEYPGGHPDTAAGLHNLGHLLQARGDPAAAEPLHREALSLFRRLYPRTDFPRGHPQLCSALTALGDALKDQDKLAEAEPVLREALAVARGLYPPGEVPAGHPGLAACLHNLGALRALKAEHGAAEPLLREALAIRRKLYTADRYPDGHPELASSLLNLGLLLTYRGDAGAGERYLRQALAAECRLAEVFLSGAAEAEAFNYLASLYPIRNTYLTASRGMPARDADAYRGVWENKAALARLAEHRRLALLAAADPKARAVAASLLAARQELAGLLLGPAGGPAGLPAPGPADRVRDLAARKEGLEKELARLLPPFAAAQKARALTPEDLVASLPEGTAFLDLVHYGHFERDLKVAGRKGYRWGARYAAFVLTPGRAARRVELGAAGDIDREVRAWRRAVAEGRADDGPARRLRRLLWEPVAGHLPAGTHTVWLSPEGALAALPWAALPGPVPGTALVEELALAVVPHGGLLLRPAAGGRGGGLLAVGGVDYGGGAAGDRLSWPALPATGRERDAVLSLADAAGVKDSLPLSGAGASAARLLAELPRARYAHLATHGFFAGPEFRSALRLDEKNFLRGRKGERAGAGARSPLVLSGLVLAGANRRGEEGAAAGAGVVAAEAIAGLDLSNLELAVLSACETGLGEVAGGEGVFGLQRAFHLAGARNVVASLWKVDDEATAALMGLFYHNLWQEKKTPLEALRLAQLTIYRDPGRIPALARERGPDFAKAARLPVAAAGGQRAHPRLWAGFVLSGPGR